MPEPFVLDESPLSAESKKIAEIELNETPERVAESTAELRRLLHENTDLYFRDDDEFLKIFLRPCHFFPESAIKLMRRIAEFKRDYAETLKNLMPEDEKDAFVNNDVVNVLCDLDQDGRRVLIVNAGKVWDPKKVTSEQLFRLFYLIHIAAMKEENTQVRGVVVIMDFDGMGMSQVRSLTPAWSKRLLNFIQDAMPLRLKQVHMVNQPFVFNMVWTLFKPFVKEKLSKRMFFHGKDRKSLMKHINAANLPANYGGELPTINYGAKDWYPAISDHIKFFADWHTYGFASSN